MLTPFLSLIIQHANSKPVLRAYVDRIFYRRYPHVRAVREDAARMRAEPVKARKRYAEDSDRLLGELFDAKKPQFKTA